MQLIAHTAALTAALGIARGSPIDVFDTSPAQVDRRHDPTHTGYATVYDQDGTTGSCGHTHTDNSMIVAISEDFDVPYFCGRKVRITNTGPTSDSSIGGKGNVVYATVADTCPGCGKIHLDLSRGAWSALTNGAADSVVGISWYFCNADGSC